MWSKYSDSPNSAQKCRSPEFRQFTAYGRATKRLCCAINLPTSSAAREPDAYRDSSDSFVRARIGQSGDLAVRRECSDRQNRSVGDG